MKIRPAIATGSAILVAACAGSAAPTAGSATAAAASLEARGTLVVAVDAASAPYAFVDSGGHVLGLEADLAQALANALGYRLRVIAAPSETIIPGLVSGEYDLGMSFADTRAREKAVDLVTYLSPGTSLYVRAAAGLSLGKLADLCGRTVAVVRGTAQAAAATAQAASCTATGRPAVKISVVGDPDGMELAVANGRVQAGMADSTVAAYTVQQSRGRLKLAGPTSARAPLAIAVPKADGMAPELVDALETVIGDGRYLAILARWSAQGGAIATPGINVAAG